MRKLPVRIMISVLILSFIPLLAGCNPGTISSDDVTVPSDTSSVVDSYLLLETEIKEFNALFNLYMRTHTSEMDVKNGNGKTYNGEECTFTYTTTKQYKTLTLTKSYSDKTVVDEYFKLDDGALFLARSTVYTNGTVEPVDKYIVRKNKLLFIDETDKTVKTLADLSTDDEEAIMKDKDMFLHFEDIEYVYEK
ncbi:MAG: hypothetical protein J5778_05515 [Clostridiales bacterium]|nr:hypothetical protein [Clostridiales bacterium]